MHIFGMHILDALLIVAYFIGVFWIAFRISKRITGTKEYFLAGRKMGRFYQFFLNFGAATDASQAAAVSREIYRQGIAGMWIQYIVLFLTPFYWFTALLFRRVRLTTIGDYFEERFDSRFLGSAYAVFAIVLSLLTGAMGYLVSAKTFMALTPKPFAEYSIEERLSVEQYKEYQELHNAYLNNALESGQASRYETLKSLNNQGKLNAFISYTNPTLFYLIYATCVCLYVMLGGFEAAAVTDALQGVLMIFFSLLLVPFGLYAIGGFSGLHEKVPEHMFWLFGTETLSEYAWYTIAAMALANLVSIVAVAPNMQTIGSAKDEGTARFGNIGGMMLKRLMMIFWALAGLIAVGLYAGELSDPDLAWGHMT
ncbi:MAG: sodium:solute symporter, partial [bacterium]